MQHQASSAPDAPPADERLSEILALAGRIVERQSEDPFGNPVLGIALNLSRRLDENSLDVDALGGLVRRRGGAQQYLLPNRNLWSAPVLIGTIRN